MDKNLTDMSKAYAIMRRAMYLCGWHHLYYKIRLSSDEINDILYHNKKYALCMIVYDILLSQIIGRIK